jgi:hypothetical protein
LRQFHSSHGTEGRTLRYAENGLDFLVIGTIDDNYPKASRCFLFDDFKGRNIEKEYITWGISMFYGDRSKNI